jgi:hypothetical protein
MAYAVEAWPEFVVTNHPVIGGMQFESPDIIRGVEITDFGKGENLLQRHFMQVGVGRRFEVEIPPAGPRTEAQQEQSGKQQNPMQQNLRITWLIIGNIESVTKTRHVADAKFEPPAVKWLRVSCYLPAEPKLRREGGKRRLVTRHAHHPPHQPRRLLLQEILNRVHESAT